MALEEITGLREEAAKLESQVMPFDAATWWRPTPFKGWSPFDVIAHLHLTDQSGLLAIEDPQRFTREAEERMKSLLPVQATLPGERIGHRDPRRLVADWSDILRRLCERLEAIDSGSRLPWFGPPMGVRMFASARLMEVWAHAQDIYDLLRRPRVHTDVIRPIAELGVRTFGWSFDNRKLPRPATKPYVRLVAPSGATWDWNDPASAERIEGSAVEFCQVVTQGRNVRDTALSVLGDGATQWMAIAQCFAGGPKDPPAPGERAW